MKVRYFFFVISSLLFIMPVYSQIPNSGFEDWETDPDGNNNPVGWLTTNTYPYINVEPSSPGYQGSYAVKVKTIDIGIIFPGVTYVETAYNFTQRPTKFTAVVKSNIMPGDQAYIMLALMQGDSAVAAMDSCTFKINSTIGQFTVIEFPIVYISNLMPDSYIVMIASGLLGGQVGTELTVDEVGFIYGTTDVSDEIVLPEDYELYQNYPNPFNPLTTIRYSISNPAFVSLKVYDILGNEVSTLVNEEKPAGNYSVEFSAAGGNAAELSSGIYFYKLQLGNFYETKKMLLLK